MLNSHFVNACGLNFDNEAGIVRAVIGILWSALILLVQFVDMLFSALACNFYDPSPDRDIGIWVVLVKYRNGNPRVSFEVLCLDPVALRIIMSPSRSTHTGAV